MKNYGILIKKVCITTPLTKTRLILFKKQPHAFMKMHRISQNLHFNLMNPT